MDTRKNGKKMLEVLKHSDVKTFDAYILENRSFPNIVESLEFTRKELISYLIGEIKK